MLTLERAKELNDSMVTEEHLRLHAKNVMYAMGAMAVLWVIIKTVIFSFLQVSSNNFRICFPVL